MSLSPFLYVGVCSGGGGKARAEAGAEGEPTPSAHRGPAPSCAGGKRGGVPGQGRRSSGRHGSVIGGSRGRSSCHDPRAHMPTSALIQLLMDSGKNCSKITDKLRDKATQAHSCLDPVCALHGPSARAVEGQEPLVKGQPPAGQYHTFAFWNLLRAQGWCP